jgi:Tfp pilus assembly protein PilN
VINLLPSDLKEQIRYAKYNRLAVQYVRVSVLVVVVLGVIFAWSIYQLGQQTKTIAADVAEKQAVIAALNTSFTPKAKDAGDRLDAIKYVLATQTRFSALVADIAKVVPQGVSINSMTLTGNDKAPVQISVTASSYAGALAFRNALITSPRISGADLETITSSNGTTYETSVVVAFKPGMAK